MKILRSPIARTQGITLVVALIATGLVAFVLAAYLTLLGAQNNTTMRSQAWNASIPVIEAGCEEALTHLYVHGSSNLLCDGWTYSSNQYTMTRWVGESSFYIAGISNYPAAPVIISLGYVEIPGLVSTETYPIFASGGGTLNTTKTYLLRGVRLTSNRNGIFVKAMVARGTITMSGNVLADSYDSSNPLYSTNGQYISTKRKDNGDVASDGQLINQITGNGSVTIYGHIATGPGGTAGLDGVVSVGDKAWVDGGSVGIKDGWFRDDMNVSFPDVGVPFAGGFTPSNGSVGGTNYTYVLTSGNYVKDSISLNSYQTIMVTGHASLYVRGNLSLTAQSSIIIGQNASLNLYVGGANGSLAGQGVLNGTGYATNFVYYGLTNNTSVSLEGGSGFTGIIYAPRANLDVAGGSTINGSTVSGTVSAAGGFNFHYDESLANFGGGGAFNITSWNEITPRELGSTIITMVPPPR